MNIKLTSMTIGAILAAIAVAIPPAAAPGAAGAPAPGAVVLVGVGFARLPDGALVELPPGTQIDVCVEGNKLFTIDPLGRTVIVPKPCSSTFYDGFEDN